MNRPVGSMAKPRGWFSVGVLPRYASLPLAASTLKALIRVRNSRGV
jgi:hypothetical protein